MLNTSNGIGNDYTFKQTKNQKLMPAMIQQTWDSILDFSQVIFS